MRKINVALFLVFILALSLGSTSNCFSAEKSLEESTAEIDRDIKNLMPKVWELKVDYDKTYAEWDITHSRLNESYKPKTGMFDAGVQEQVLTVLHKLMGLSNELYYQCQIEMIPGPQGLRHILGLHVIDVASVKTCTAITLTAKSLAISKSRKNKDIAKQLFRDLVIRYTGSKYTGYVRAAQFALDDLR
jgi:hypothetical protein